MNMTMTSLPATIASTMMSPAETSLLVRGESSTYGSRSELVAPRPSSSRSSSSTTSIPFRDNEVEVVTLDGLPHADVRLTARHYKSQAFARQLLVLLAELGVPSWCETATPSDSPVIQKVSGSLTNAVFFVSRPASRTLLLRIYGVSSGSLISRPRELHTLHILSSQHRIGPRIYGTFENGRVEEYFDSIALAADDLRDERISRWIGARMAELHRVNIAAIENTGPGRQGEANGWEIAASSNVRSWLLPARDVLALPSVSDATRRELDLDAFEREWQSYMQWLSDFERREGASPRVFCHNDAQYGNLLRLTRLKEDTPEHRQIIVVDFEYSSPNPAAFDIANHFHEWTANYHSATPHLLQPSLYPTLEQRRNFYWAYLTHYHSNCTPPSTDQENVPDELDVKRLDMQVRAWSPASHAMWAIWGIVQAREDLEGKEGELEFDYIGYAKCRMEGFRREVQALYC